MLKSFIRYTMFGSFLSLAIVVVRCEAVAVLSVQTSAKASAWGPSHNHTTNRQGSAAASGNTFLSPDGFAFSAANGFESRGVTAAYASGSAKMPSCPVQYCGPGEYIANAMAFAATT